MGEAQRHSPFAGCVVVGAGEPLPLLNDELPPPPVPDTRGTAELTGLLERRRLDGGAFRGVGAALRTLDGGANMDEVPRDALRKVGPMWVTLGVGGALKEVRRFGF